MDRLDCKAVPQAPIWRCRRGQGLTELAVALPALLMLALGLIEVNRAIETQHTIASLTREGANVASRGGTLSGAVEATRANQLATGLGSGGGVVATRIVVTGGVPRVAAQVASDGFEQRSQVGRPDSVAIPYQTMGLTEGRQYHVVEVFLPYRSATGFERIMPGILPGVLYDRTLF